MIRCGHCYSKHPTVQDIKDCHFLCVRCKAEQQAEDRWLCPTCIEEDEFESKLYQLKVGGETTQTTKATTRQNRINWYLKKVTAQTGSNPLNRWDSRYSETREQAFWDAVERYFPEEEQDNETQEDTTTWTTDERVRTGLHVKLAAGDTSNISLAELRRVRDCACPNEYCHNPKNHWSQRSWKLWHHNIHVCTTCGWTPDSCICT